MDRNTEYKMARMYKQGLTANEIAKRFGYKTRNSVLQKLDKLNIKIRFVENEYNGIYLIRSARRVNIELLKSKVYNKSFGMERKYKLLL